MTPFQTQFKSLQDNQKLLGLLLFSLITVVIWISISLITSQKKTVISEESKALAKPLNPSINVEVLDLIDQKRLYTTMELESFPIYVLFDEQGNPSIFDNSDQTFTVQPSGLGTLNTPATPVASDSAEPNAFPNESPLPTASPEDTPQDIF